MKITKSEINKLVFESVSKQNTKLKLENRAKEIKEELGLLNEFVDAPASVGTSAKMYDTGTSISPAEDEKKESILDARPGEIIVFNFQDVTIKAQKQYGDLFQITDATESQRLQDGDYIKIQGNDILQKGRKFKFIILREAKRYETNPLISWRVIKNK